ncbi:MAG TPA: type 1 glutamine amidotransferase [Candidatus Lustribacter sp.]|nr:type 1 glutamine amidotransferase [Candidatus Lustribacter sp.]
MVRALLVVEHEADASLGRFARWFDAAGLGVEVVRPYGGERLPADLRGYAGLLVCGGSPAAWEDDVAPWLPQTRALLRDGVSDAIPTLGLCLGGQLLANATGGQARRGSAGPEVGLGTVLPTAAAAGDPLFAHLPALGLPAAQWHVDEIAELPPKAVLLATGTPYPRQAFRLGQRAWGLQFHPEVTAAGFGSWGRTDPVPGVDMDAARASVFGMDAALEAAWRPLALAFASVVCDR